MPGPALHGARAVGRLLLLEAPSPILGGLILIQHDALGARHRACESPSACHAGRLSMFFRLMPFLLMLVGQQVVAFEFPIQITEYLDDRKIVVFINEGDIAENRNWNPQSEAPPLSMTGALSAVRNTMAAEEGAPAAELLEIELKQIPHHPLQWHYLVKMTTRDGGEQIPSYFVVLMNAKVIPALPRPESLS